MILKLFYGGALPNGKLLGRDSPEYLKTAEIAEQCLGRLSTMVAVNNITSAKLGTKTVGPGQSAIFMEIVTNGNHTVLVVHSPPEDGGGVYVSFKDGEGSGAIWAEYVEVGGV